MKNNLSMSAKVFGLSVLASALLLAPLVNAETRIERDGKVYVVTENNAAAVCKSIVRDQPAQLRSALFHGIRGLERQRAHKYYLCNNQNLLSFARSVEANKVVSYLIPKFNYKQTITTEEVAAR